MKARKSLILAFFLAVGLVFMMPSCKTGEGCNYGTGEVDMSSSKRGKSNLFSKKTRKKMKKRSQ